MSVVLISVQATWEGDLGGGLSMKQTTGQTVL